ncbi:hypothetical protein [Halopelagius inordinatus]|nr:hypothetical protein [Halopelagius inordinatus]
MRLSRDSKQGATRAKRAERLGFKSRRDAVSPTFTSLCSVNSRLGRFL